MEKDLDSSDYLLTGDQSSVSVDSMSEEFMKYLLSAFGFDSRFTAPMLLPSSSKTCIGAVGGMFKKISIDFEKMEEAKNKLREMEEGFLKRYKPA